MTGIGTVDCARHDMKRPNGVGDLQKGERCVFVCQPAKYDTQSIGYLDILTWIISFLRVFPLQ